MGPTGNLQGSYKFLCLDTWRKIVRKRWTELPMPSHIIDKVNKMGLADSNLTLKFLYRHKAEYVFDEEDNYDIDKGEDKKNDMDANFPGIEMGTVAQEFEDLDFQEDNVYEVAEESKYNADTPINETGYVVNDQQVEMNAVQPDQLDEPTQNEFDGELDDAMPEIMDENAESKQEIEDAQNNLHNNGEEDENTDNLMKDETLSQQQNDEQQ